MENARDIINELIKARDDLQKAQEEYEKYPQVIGGFATRAELKANENFRKAKSLFEARFLYGLPGKLEALRDAIPRKKV